ncbi:MAG: hypothetical protein R6U32_00880 [Candidatus Woesearchaeota archaeon]
MPRTIIDILEEDMDMEEEDIYTRGGIEEIYEDDGITDIEEAFMKGYLGC